MYWCREMFTPIRYNSSMFLRMDWLMSGISATNSSVFNKLGNLTQARIKGPTALFKTRKLFATSPKNYLTKAVNKFSDGFRPTFKNEGLKRFDKISPHVPQPKLTIRQPLRQEPAALRQLRAQNDLIAKLPSPPTHTPVVKPANGSKTPEAPLQFNQKNVMKTISRAKTVAELVEVWTDLKTMKENGSIKFEQAYTPLKACGDRLFKLCSKPDQVDQIDDNILNMIMDPEKRAKAHFNLIDTRYENR